MNCKVCQHNLDDHDFNRLEVCIGYLKKEIEVIAYSIHRLPGMGEKDDQDTAKITHRIYNILGINCEVDLKK